MPNLIVLNDEIGWGNSSADVVREKLDEFQGQPVKVEINSPGGSVIRGLEIFHLFKNYAGFVHMHVMSLAASMASIIPLAGNKITAEETTIWVIHNVFGGEWGDYRDLQKEADVLRGLRDLMANLYSKRLNKNVEEIKKIMDKETFFFGEEALKFGLADEIIMLPEKDKENKSDSIAYAKIQMEDCNKKTKERAEIIDFEKVASLIKINNEKTLDKNSVISDVVKNGSIPAISAGQNKKMEVSKMTLEEFKNENPGLYNEIFKNGVQAGIKKENDRVLSHLTWIEDAPKAVIEAIEKNEDFSGKHSSIYQKASMNKKDITARIDDNVDAVKPTDVVDKDQAVKNMTDDILARMKPAIGQEGNIDD